MTKKIAIILGVALLFGIILRVPARAEFEDVPRDHWAYEAVGYLEENGFVIGYPDGTFQGDRLLSRYEFAMVVSRLCTEFLDLQQNGTGLPVDQQAVLEMLLDEFQPDLDRLRDLIDINTARIGVVENTTEELSTQVSDLATQVENIGPSSSFNASGDLRVRFEGLYPETGLQTQRARYRLRWGFTSAIHDELTFGARFASGSDGGLTSTNDTFDDIFGFDQITIDQAYLRYSPVTIPGLVLYGGKFAPPWVNTPMVWDSDATVEGLAQTYTQDNFHFYLGEMVPTVEGYYFLAQAGADDIMTEGLDFYATYHYIDDNAWQWIMQDMVNGDLKNRFVWDRLDNPDNYSAIEGYGKYSTDIGTMPVSIEGNYLRNLAGTAEDAGSGLLQAAWVQVSINGSPSNPGDWRLRGEWGRTQANSVLSWLTDADRGSGDTEWWGASWTYRLMRNTDLAITYLNTDRLMREGNQQDLIQVDISTKF